MISLKSRQVSLQTTSVRASGGVSESKMAGRDWDPRKTYGISDAERLAVQEKGRARQLMRMEWQKKVTDPHRGVGGTIVSLMACSTFRKTAQSLAALPLARLLLCYTQTKSKVIDE